jgi:hypothetical protein
MIDVFGEGGLELAAVDDEHPVEQFPAECAVSFPS